MDPVALVKPSPISSKKANINIKTYNTMTGLVAIATIHSTNEKDKAKAIPIEIPVR